MKRILITGAKSYIGESVKDYLMNSPDQYEVHIKDTIGWKPVTDDFDGFDIVFNVAGIAHIKETAENRHLYYDVNRDLVIKIATVAKKAGVKQFILLSTMSVYGMVTGHITKGTMVNPVNAYGKSKVEADEAMERLVDENFKFCCLRPPMVYGKGCKGNYQTLRQFALKSPVFPEIDNKRSMIYIGNLCEFVKRCIDKEMSGLFFPQNAEYTNTSLMVEKIAEINGKKIKLTRALNWAVRIYKVNTIKKVFGDLVYESVDTVGKYGFEESIRMTEKKENSSGENKKPIIIVLSSYTPSLFWYRIDMMKCFIERGYDVYAVAEQSEEEWKEKFKKLGINYRQISIQRNGMNPLKDIQTIKEIDELYKELKPKKVFTYQAKSTIYGGIAARKAGNIDVYPMIGGIGSVFLSNTLRARIIRFIVRNEYKIALKKSKAVFFQNTDDLITFQNNKIIKNQRICMLAGSGVNSDYYMQLPLPQKTSFLLTARLIRDKGVGEYLQACEKLKSEYKDVRCLLVGPYDTNPTAIKKEELQPYIEKNIVEYFGSQDDVRPYIKQCSVFVLPSYREGTPKAVLEAMSCERAILTTDTTGCRETVVDGKNGYLVPVKDAQSLFEKMKYMVENPHLVMQMAKESRKMAVSRFDVQIVNRKICETMQI